MKHSGCPRRCVVPTLEKGRRPRVNRKARGGSGCHTRAGSLDEMKLKTLGCGHRTRSLAESGGATPAAGLGAGWVEAGRSRPAWLHTWVMKPERLPGLILLAAGLCVTGCAVSSPPPPPDTFPVRCTAEVDWPKGVTLEQLKDLPVEELNHPEINIDGVWMTKDDVTNSVSVTVRTWREFDRYSDEGYDPGDNANLGLSRWFVRKRGFISFLETARPSKASYVHDLPMDRRLLKILPIKLGPQISHEEEEEAQKAIAEGKTWPVFYPKTRILEHTKTMIHFQVAWFDVWLRVRAYGDYNGDGLEDVLLYVSHEATEGTLGYSFSAVLTRAGTNQVLQMISPPGG